MLPDKAEIRAKNKHLRSLMGRDDVLSKSSLASDFFLTSEFYKSSSCIMLYKQLGNETDTSEIIKKAFEDNKKIVFPVTDMISSVITPYYADKNTVFRKGNFSVSEPVDTAIADPAELDVVLVPGIAFDLSGNRVGFGKGCYDGFLKKTRAVKIGFCYSFQICEDIPSSEYDVSVDYIICENGIKKCEV